MKECRAHVIKESNFITDIIQNVISRKIHSSPTKKMTILCDTLEYIQNTPIYNDPRYDIMCIGKPRSSKRFKYNMYGMKVRRRGFDYVQQHLKIRYIDIIIQFDISAIYTHYIQRFIVLYMCLLRKNISKDVIRTIIRYASKVKKTRHGSYTYLSVKRK